MDLLMVHALNAKLMDVKVAQQMPLLVILINANQDIFITKIQILKKESVNLAQ